MVSSLYDWCNLPQTKTVANICFIMRNTLFTARKGLAILKEKSGNILKAAAFGGIKKREMDLWELCTSVEN